MARTCSLTGKRRNVKMQISHSHVRTKKVQLPNIQTKRLFLESEGRWVRVRLSTRALRSVTRVGLDAWLRENGKTLRDIT
ncbi:MAG: 50S ribosomal protein L28 [Deltaproteobacteria bacterium]|nr:MAG: 50S ribosomal protein L28 [Deltaproteobacteria bacterium]